MAFPLPDDQLTQLKLFVQLLQNPAVGPSVLHAPQLDFFREYLLSIGASLPPKPQEPQKAQTDEATSPLKEEEGHDEEECHFERDEVDESLQQFGDVTVIVTDDMLEQSENYKNEARSAGADGDYTKATQLYTQAILLNPSSASLIAKRGETFLKLNKPMAAIHDCDRAIQLNKNCANAYYVRGKARAMIGEWEQALQDMQTADQLDSDSGAYDLLKLYREKAQAAKQKRLKKARQVPKVDEEKFEMPNFQGGFPGFGGGMPDLSNLLNNPEVMSTLSNPKVQKMMSEVLTNPGSLSKYMSDPELGPIIQKVMGSFGGSSSAPKPSSSADQLD